MNDALLWGGILGLATGDPFSQGPSDRIIQYNGEGRSKYQRLNSDYL